MKKLKTRNYANKIEISYADRERRKENMKNYYYKKI